MRIAVQGIGVVGGFGTGVNDLTEALHSTGTPPGSYSLSECGSTFEIPAFRADTEKLTDFVPLKALRRIDHFSRMGLLGAYLALDDAGILAEGRQEKLGVIIASGYGATGITFAFQDSFIHDGDICASPTYFANSVHNSAAANIAMMLGATGPSSTVSQFQMSVPSALQTAQLWLSEGRVDRVLFGAVDELSELIGYTFYRQRGRSIARKMMPLATDSESAIPGEGAAFLLLSRNEESGQGYCLLDRVVSGRQLHPATRLTENELLLVGADGRKVTGQGYRVQAEGARVACFTPHYGRMPAAAAFDLSAAAIMLKHNIVFPSPHSSSCDFAARIATEVEPLATGISCLTLDDDGGYGLVNLERL